MKKEENQIDSIFRDAAHAFGVDPPAAVWDRVSSGLSSQARHVRMLWYKRMSVAASILLAFFIGYYFPGKEAPQTSISQNIAPFSRVIPSAPRVLTPDDARLNTGNQTMQSSRNSASAQVSSTKQSASSAGSNVQGSQPMFIASSSSQNTPFI